jgi:hypothetical protein
MYRKQLPRVYELRDMAQSPPSAEAYFSDFDQTHDGSKITMRAHLVDGKAIALGEPEEGRGYGTLQYGLARMRELIENAGG